MADNIPLTLFWLAGGGGICPVEFVNDSVRRNLITINFLQLPMVQLLRTFH